MTTSKLHSLRLEEILCYPEDTVGICGVEWGSSEVVFRNKDGSNKAEIDVLFYTGRTYKFPYHVIEFKNSPHKRKQAIEQLQRGGREVRKYLNGDAHQYFVWRKRGIYVVEKLK